MSPADKASRAELREGVWMWLVTSLQAFNLPVGVYRINYLPSTFLGIYLMSMFLLYPSLAHCLSLFLSSEFGGSFSSTVFLCPAPLCPVLHSLVLLGSEECVATHNKFYRPSLTRGSKAWSNSCADGKPQTAGNTEDKRDNRWNNLPQEEGESGL